MTTSRGKLATLHRRQSALNLPSQSASEMELRAASSRDYTPAIRSVRSPLATPDLSLPADQKPDNELEDQEPSPTNRNSYREELSKRWPQHEQGIVQPSSGSRGLMMRRGQMDSTAKDCDTETSTLENGEEESSAHGSSRAQMTHLRTLSRDFVLPSIPPSSVRHENCSSLKDQFLKIKERFSPSMSPATVAPSPLAIKQVISSAATCLAATPTNNDATTMTSEATSTSHSLAHADKGDDGNWEFPHARVERWYREDDFFKACITCWTMEAGAAIVAKIAGVVSKWVSETTDGSGNTARINPDVSLQWIGRQLWAVTVSLPLTRSGELHEEHITLAHRINEAVAEISKREDASSIVSPLSSSTDALQEIPTEGYRDDKPTSTYTIDPRGLGEPQPLSPVHVEREQDADSSEDQEATLQTSPFSTLAAEDIDILRLSQAQMADKRSVDIEKSADDGDSSNEEKQRENESDQNDDEEDEEEDNSERVAALPLSWSMLSLSSQPSGSSEPASLLGEFTTADEDTITDRAAHLAPEKTGWLKKKKRKQHGLGSSWQPRYFELKGNRLYYFASEADGLPRGAVLLDNALVQRGRGDHAMNFSISSASSHRRLQVLKFSARLTHEVNLRKSVDLRVIEETDAAVSAWVAALNRASFYSKLASATPGSSATLPVHSSSSFGPLTTPDRKRKTPFYRFRCPTTTKSASLPLSAEKEQYDVEEAITKELRTTSARWTASYQQLGSVQYLRETDPLLWEIHPPEQITIRKKAARARSRGDYLAIFSRHAETFAQIFLPRPQPISLEQTLRDILPELFLINDTLYGGGDQQQHQQATEKSSGDFNQPQQNRGLEHIFEVLDAHIQRFAAAPEDRVRAVSALLQACARTISGGDSYFVVHRLLGNPNLIIRPAEARGRPIEIDVSPKRPSHFLITVFSAFSFHLLDDVERFGDVRDPNGGGMTPAPMLRVRTRHIQEFDFASGTSTRWLRIDVEGRKEDHSPGSGGGGGAGTLGRWGNRRQSHDVAESRIGALLDALS